MTENPVKIWYEDPSIIVNENYIFDFFPSKYQNLEEKMNAITRLSLYTSIVLSIYHKNWRYLYIAIFVLILTFLLYSNYKVEKMSDEPDYKFLDTPNVQIKTSQPEPEAINSEKCTKPTLDNPFMNVTMADYMNYDDKGVLVDRPEACSVMDTGISKKATEYFKNNLYRDVTDVYGRVGLERNFYTMPSTTIPNRQDEFAKWLYLSPPTCKEEKANCLKYEDLRAKSFVFPNPEENPVATKKIQ